ncbi:MAG: glycosyltransferase [Candidatus Eremiobacteraeota bacterium]|nr:glycosyltransferase [Candidatus Eremiobacteraeota bacterium]
MVAYYFPPQPKAGALRPAYLARYLPDFGWEPTVLTVDYPGDPPRDCHVVRVRQTIKTSKLAKSSWTTTPRHRTKAELLVRGLARSMLYFPDDAVSWLLPARHKAFQLCKETHFDALASTLPPPTAHFVARTVAKGFQLPWLADYRDLWSGPPDPYFERNFGSIRRIVSYAFERWLLKPASALTAPTRAHAKALGQYFRFPDVRVIPNACDLDVWKSLAIGPPPEFSLCYTGTLYPNLRTPKTLFSAVSRLRAIGDPAAKDIRLDFYGENPTFVTQFASNYGITDIVRVHGEVDRLSAMRAQRNAAVLILLLDTDGVIDRVEVANPGSKVLEYAGAGRPILALGSKNNEIRHMLDTTRLGLFASDETSCIGAIRNLHNLFKQGVYRPAVNPSWHPYAPRDLAGDFAAVLDRLTAKKLKYR